AATAHDEDSHRGLIQRRALHHMIEEPQPVRPPISGPCIEFCIRPELHITEAGVAAVAMRPRPQDKPLLASPRALQPQIVARRRQRVRIPPRRQVHARGAAVMFVPTLGPYAELLPELVERTMRPLIEQIGLIIRMMPQWRMARLPRHAREPLADVL